MARAWRFLLVDGSSTARDAYRAAIQSAWPEASVREADSAERALDLMRDENTDVVVSDHDLRSMKGVELFEHLRREHPKAKRILVSARPDEDMEREAIHSARVHALLAKADGPAVVRERLGMLLRDE